MMVGEKKTRIDNYLLPESVSSINKCLVTCTIKKCQHLAISLMHACVYVFQANIHKRKQHSADLCYYPKNIVFLDICGAKERKSRTIERGLWRRTQKREKKTDRRHCGKNLGFCQKLYCKQNGRKWKPGLGLLGFAYKVCSLGSQRSTV